MDLLRQRKDIKENMVSEDEIMVKEIVEPRQELLNSKLKEVSTKLRRLREKHSRKERPACMKNFGKHGR
jgi:predicted nuclease with TOPRIM domain